MIFRNIYRNIYIFIIIPHITPPDNTGSAYLNIGLRLQVTTVKKNTPPGTMARR